MGVLERDQTSAESTSVQPPDGEPPRPDGSDLLSALRESVRHARERAELAALQSRNAAGLAKDLFDRRKEYREAMEVLRSALRDGHGELVERETLRALHRHIETLGESRGRGAFLTTWISVLPEALEEVREILESADAYEAFAEGETDEDRAYREAIRRKTAERWRAA